MRAFVTDLVFAARTFRKKPAFAITAIATLALGIGSTTAIFSVVNAVLLEPLPYAAPDQLVHVWHDLRTRNVTRFPWAPADFHDLRTQATMFSEVAALTTGRQVIVPEGGAAEAEVVRTGNATPNIFRLLGARIVQGSDFTDADGTPLPAPAGDGGGQAPVADNPPPPLRAILSYEFWQRKFGANPAIVGTLVALGQQRIEVVGVLAPGFEVLLPPGVHIERAPDQPDGNSPARSARMMRSRRTKLRGRNRGPTRRRWTWRSIARAGAMRWNFCSHAQRWQWRCSACYAIRCVTHPD
jgi:putative ABC transport system permease protein